MSLTVQQKQQLLDTYKHDGITVPVITEKTTEEEYRKISREILNEFHKIQEQKEIQKEKTMMKDSILLFIEENFDHIYEKFRESRKQVEYEYECGIRMM